MFVLQGRSYKIFPEASRIQEDQPMENMQKLVVHGFPCRLLPLLSTGNSAKREYVERRKGGGLNWHSFSSGNNRNRVLQL